MMRPYYAHVPESETGNHQEIMIPHDGWIVGVTLLLVHRSSISEGGFGSAAVSLTTRQLNHQEYRINSQRNDILAFDMLSFVFEDTGGPLAGSIIANPLRAQSHTPMHVRFNGSDSDGVRDRLYLTTNYDVAGFFAAATVWFMEERPQDVVAAAENAALIGRGRNVAAALKFFGGSFHP